MMPREIVLLCQRLPKESVASKTNEKEVMNQMRTILDRQPGQELIDSELGLPFSAIEVKDCLHRRTTFLRILEG